MKYTQLPKRGAYIVFVRSKGAISRMIQLGMWLYQAIQLKKYPEKSFNHTDFLIDGWVSGAIGRGVETRSVWEAYRKKNPKLRLFKISDDAEDINRLRWFIQNNSHKKYEFSNFWNHAKKIFTGKWAGKVGDDATDRYYCIEFCADGMNRIIQDFQLNAHEVNPYDFMETCREKLEEV